jgi:formate/nitrite transporter FocA (FNT family)
MSEAVRDHPLEESQKNYETILEQQVEQSTKELERGALALFLSGLTAGLDIGFGPFTMAVFSTLTRDTAPHALQRFVTANLYTIGFVFVVLGHSALFTEHTTSAVQPVLEGRASLGRLLRLWGIVLAANLLGAAIFSGFAVWLGPALGAADARAFGELAHGLVQYPSSTMFLSAVGAGWVMGMLAWLTTAARDTIGQLVVVWLCALVIGLAGLHHVVAGTVEVLLGVFSGQGATTWDFARFLACAVSGNAVGGAVFVGLLKFAHVRA